MVARCLVALAVAASAASAQTFANADRSARLTVDVATGRLSLALGDSVRISDAYGGIQLDTYVRTIDYPDHTASSTPFTDALGAGRRVDLVHRQPGKPTLTQRFQLYDGRPRVTVELIAAGEAEIGATWIGPLVVDGAGAVSLGALADPRALRVPFDNDAWSRYLAGPLDRNDTSHEVAAFYDGLGRSGLIAGAVTHDTWKNGVYFLGRGGKLDKLNLYGGAADGGSHDTAPHGRVTGRTVTSERFELTACDDWRDGLERFADDNAKLRPALPWTGGVLFGWNSWGKIQTKLNYAKAAAVARFLHDQAIPRGFVNAGTLYLNLDSYWDNLSQAQLTTLSALCRDLGLKLGIYWAPFVYWGDNLTRRIDNTPTLWDEAILKTPDGKPQKLDGGYALDPTHPAVKARNDRVIARFKALGIGYLKLDFLSHGALEGRHFDPAVQTGIQAYHRGMRDVLAAVGDGVFVSLSISPLFPHGYGHSRRVGCDSFGAIGDTEYMLNNAGYGWWASGRLYRFGDPDHLVTQGFTPSEQRSRLTGGALAGTVFVNGDDLSDPAAQPAMLELFSHQAVLDVARLGHAFRPVEGTSGDRAPDTFVLEAGGSRFLAVFNTGKVAITKHVDLRRCFPVGPLPTILVDRWDGTHTTATAQLDLPLAPAACMLWQAQ